MNILWIIVVTLLITSASYAGEEPIKVREVVVSATKFEESIEETTSSVRVIPEERIEAKNEDFIVEVLKDTPEVNVVQNGGVGKQASVILRGASPTQTLILIDGVKVKSTTTGNYDLSGITAHDIESIEVVKGPQSTIYGSEAMAGVINIITKKGGGKPGLKASFEGGSFSTYSPSATVSGELGGLDFRLTGTYLESNGISAAREGDERDGYKNASFSGKVGLRPSETFEAEISGRYYYDRSDLDAFGVDDLNYVQYGNHYIIAGKAKLYLIDTWEQVLSVSRVYDALKFRDPDTAPNNADLLTRMNTVDWQHTVYLLDEYTLTAGGEYREEKGENESVFREVVDNRALYLNNKLKLLDDDLILNAGVRYDDHETFGEETTFRVGGTYHVRPAAVTLRSSYGTGFRAPTLNELYYQDNWSSGNPDLEPEKSRAWEIGIDKEIIHNKISASITFFQQKYSDLIDWTESPPGSFQFSPKNISRAEVKGIETGITVQMNDYVGVSSYYTYTDTKDKDTGMRLTRRPDDKLNVAIDVLYGPATLLANYTFAGKAFDSSARRNLSSYSLVDLSGSYMISKNLKLYGRIDNVFDEDYETAGGFNTPGLTAYAGIEMTL